MSSSDKKTRPSAKAKALASSLLEGHEKGREGITFGGCMWPFLPAGVRVVPSDRFPEVGEVAVYESGGALRAHRVVGLFDGGVFARSDRPGSGLERVCSSQILGVWESGAGVRTVFLKPRVGSLVARLSMALSRPAVLGVLRSIWRGLPVLRPPLLNVGVFAGGAAELAEALTLAGLNPQAPTLEEAEAIYLCPNDGFVVLSRVGRRPFGAAAVRVRRCVEVSQQGRSGERPQTRAGMTVREGELTIGVRRYFRHPEVLDAILHVVLDEAVDRGFSVLEAEAREAAGRNNDDGSDRLDGLEAAALRRRGFSCVDPEHRRVPSTGQRVVLYRWEAH